MSDTLMSILGITLAVLLMFIFPVIAIASQHDQIAQTAVETILSDFVNTVAEKGKITEDDYSALEQKLAATGNSFDIQIELQVLDDNPERKTVTTSILSNIKGENVYYSIYSEDITDKILEELRNDKSGEYNLKKDDYITLTVKNTNVTIGTQFKNFFYSIIGKNTYVIGASSAALVTNSGKYNSEIVQGNKVNVKEEPDVYKELVTVTYVTNPYEYLNYKRGDFSRLINIKDYTATYKGELIKDISTKVVTLEKGQKIKVTSEKPQVQSGKPRECTIDFNKWVEISPSYAQIDHTAGQTITINEDKIFFAYYVFRLPNTNNYVWHEPILYFYPTEETEINVKVKYEDKLTVTYPKYDSNGWEILAKPDGTLKDLKTNRELYCLYYEANNNADSDFYKDGFIVKGEDSAKFLEEKLAILGLTEKEAEEFIIYWLPKLESNKYNYIRFASQDYINENMPLDINPAPDTFIRVFMEYQGLDEPIEIEEQQLNSVTRKGYTVVEWGGTEIK